MWRRLKLLGRAWFRRASRSGWCWSGSAPPTPYGEPETIRAVSGGSIVTLVGPPSELMLFAHGRRSVAEVKLVGEPEAIDTLNDADLRI